MRRPTPEPIEAGGQDSFVDVVTNLVGILIVLVLIVGVRVRPAERKHNASAQAAMVQAAGAASATQAKASSDSDPKSDAARVAAAVGDLQQTSAGIEHGIHEITAQIESINRVLMRRAVERDRLATLVSAGQRTIDDHRKELAAAAREDFDLRQQVSGLRTELEQSQLALARPAFDGRPPLELKHVTTPLSRTVFGKEIHFRLAQGRIAYVPIEELFERVKSEMHNVSSLAELTDTEHVVGPYGGFQMELTVEAKSGEHRGELQIRSKEWRITPVGADVGETMPEALTPTSDFHRRLAPLDPTQTTVTVWLYAEGFADYRKINEELVRLGYGVAARPLPDGRPIAGSEHGSRSAAE